MGVNLAMSSITPVRGMNMFPRKARKTTVPDATPAALSDLSSNPIASP